MNNRVTSLLPASLKCTEVSLSGPAEVSNIISKMNVNKATGLDGISVRFVKDGWPAISVLITHIINVSIDTGVIPEQLKLARVVPLYKKGSKREACNYRPISALCTISKVLEKVIYNQLNDYFIRHKLLFELQSGFRSSYSTDTCLINLCDYIRIERDKGNYTGMVLLDLQKAFDTVNHEILLSKLSAIGADEGALKWFRSYLSGRSQVTDVDGTLSTKKPIACGVPQGSILGPLLFILYVNDMCTAVSCKLIIYADDSVLLVSGKSILWIEETLHNELDSVREWLTANKLSLHLGKTESILFSTKRKLCKTNQFNVICNGTLIDSKSNVTYLGLMLDQTLSGELIAQNIINKCSRKLRFLYRNTKHFNLITKKQLIYALIQCHFDYTCSAWYSGISKKMKCKLQCAQNKVIRYTLNTSPMKHIGAYEFILVGILPVDYRVEQLKLGHMFNIMNESAPSYLMENVHLVQSQHSYSTRISELSFAIPRVCTAGKCSFLYTSILHWNGLPVDIKNIHSKSRFKNAVKKHLRSRLIHEEKKDFVHY